jgi:hypothetical protein
LKYNSGNSGKVHAVGRHSQKIKNKILKSDAELLEKEPESNRRIKGIKASYFDPLLSSTGVLTGRRPAFP